MNCDRCGWMTEVETTKNANFEVRRERKCLACGNSMHTIEIPARFYTTSAGQRQRALATIEKRIHLFWRDVSIAQNSHIGWIYLSKAHNLTRTAVYLAARRGRKFIQRK